MDNLHQLLKIKYDWYGQWHTNSAHTAIHWAVLGAFFLFINFFVLSAATLPVTVSTLASDKPVILEPSNRIASVPQEFTITSTQVLGASDSSLNTQTAIDSSTPEVPPPTVQITNPRNNSTLQNGAPILIQAVTSQYSQIKKVELHEGSRLICSVTAAPYSCNWTTPDRNSTISITATVYDMQNNTGKDTIRFITRDLTQIREEQ